MEEKPDDFDFELPHFADAEEGQAWLDSLPHEEAEVDERLKKRVSVTMNLHQLMVDGFDYLAKRMGLNSGKDLMYIVLSQYLGRNLPDDF
ncbi:MAG: hypothetical protein E3J21_09335 [Anaerolineales bacterium]|nr:MAG: hypothetical protein E3J21_09335 [Anaerolineales bacterium]